MFSSTRLIILFTVCVIVIIYYSLLQYLAIMDKSSIRLLSTDLSSTPAHKPNIFVLMVDTRSPDNHTKSHTITASIANYYCALHHCEFIYYVIKCSMAKQMLCFGYRNISVPVQWMKVKGILHMLHTKMNYGDLALYVDTDFVFNHNTSLSDFISKDININDQTFDQLALCWDYASYWSRISRKTYKYPINSGIILFYKTISVELIMQKWWQSVQIPSTLDKVPKVHPKTGEKTFVNHAFDWPYEQDRLSYLVSTGLFKDDVVLFKETYVDKLSIGWHLAMIKGPKILFVVNASKMTFIPQCKSAKLFVSAHANEIQLNHCDKSVTDSYLMQSIDKWKDSIQVTYIEVYQHV
eukprot:429543_1